MSATRGELMGLLVWGYTRNIEKEHKHLNIPEEINNIIYLYQKLCDEWDRKYCHPALEIDADISGISFIMMKLRQHLVQEL